VSNALITSTEITQEMLRVLHNRSAMLGKITTDYQADFGKKGEKVGSTIYVRRPAQYTVRSGAVANVQDVTESSVPLVIQPEFGIDFAFSDFDLSLTLDRFSERYIVPAAKRLATELDVRIVTAMLQSVGNSVGVPGTPPASQQAAQKLALDAGVMLTNNAADRADRQLVTTPTAQANLLQYLNLGFNSQKTIGAQYDDGTIGRALGWNWQDSQNMVNQAVGPLGGTPLVNGANQGLTNAGTTDNPYGATTALLTKGWTAAAAARLVVGDVFTIAGVFAVNPENKQSLGTLRQFVVTANFSSDASGNGSVTISPAIIAGGAFQNVTARPADGAAITVLGTASTSYPVSLGFVKEAFTMATVPLELPNGMDMASRAQSDGVSIRFVRGFDITNNRRISRFDILAGYAAVRPEWATRIYAG
jgi:hypothetical protein